MVRPLGSSQEDRVDVRIVSATHRELGGEVEAGRFRQDLYYRLNVIVISVPPLRERRDDLPDLCDALLARICQESGFAVPRLDESVLEQLLTHPFNGNVRELENILHRAVALSEGGVLHLDAGMDRPADPALTEPVAAALVAVPENLQDYLDAQERSILCQVLVDTRFNRTAAAARLGLSLRQIRYRIARLNIAMPDSDNPTEQVGIADGSEEGSLDHP